MSLDKRFTKPPKDNPHAVFKYGVECGIDFERDRILSIIKEEQCDCSEDCDRLDINLQFLLDRINNV